ncbi:DUF2268 domain-containing putative Zn-dependent protease [Herbaspirillum seropedicae]|uniref:DUF2268 domain-containing putative Zn-dependent protease n=1 Tax=Herbaspirillum seropedicae TaxID=964 RepID=UPI000863A460|nr:DUF2268 domain-containing putative Zn-dependent protease [Herbaspirillum seropedicae]AON53791.1 hypothetical protein Hsc_1488 [Herbaspirillum seropedicae]
MDNIGLNLHFLNARGALTPFRSWITDALWETYRRASSLISLGHLDVVVQTGKQVIPEKGHIGYSSAPGIIFITVDPCHPSFLSNRDASLERMFAHELHHAARWDGPGYGVTLGEALISEGMAGHFAQEVCRGGPEPWETLDVDEIQNYLLLAEEDWDRNDYDHLGWFFGTSELPRWLGYSLGYQIVHQFSVMRQHLKASAMVNIDAQEFRACLRLLKCETKTKSIECRP